MWTTLTAQINYRQQQQQQHTIDKQICANMDTLNIQSIHYEKIDSKTIGH